jgi:hypothetical protein
MPFHFVAEEPAKIPTICVMQEPRYHVVPQLGRGGDTQTNPNSVLTVEPTCVGWFTSNRSGLFAGAAVLNHE